MTVENPVKLPRVKTCKGCGVKFQPMRALQVACSVECAYKVARINGTKAKAAKYRSDKKRMKSRADWLKEAQAAVNRYVRLRDAGKPCISCGRHHQGQYHAGHYRSVGSSPELRFELLNINSQCAPCNNHLSGNIVEYRKGLIEKIGVKMVEWLEGPHAAAKYTIEQLEEIKAEYVRLAKEIESKC